MRLDHRRLLVEGPTVVGMVTASLESGGSLDTAARTVAADGPPMSRIIFTEAVRMADTKGARDIRSAVLDRVSRLPESASGYRRAVHMCLAASDSADRQERRGMLEDASRTALDSVREMGESYGASLNMPFMTVFGLGIMVPMILMSILPMLGIGGMFGGVAVDPGMISAVTLVGVPLVILTVCLGMRSSNPFLSAKVGIADVRHALPMLCAIPLFAVYASAGVDSVGVLLYSLAPAAIATMVLMYGDRREDLRRIRCERGLRDSVLDLGNRMMSGENFEEAAVGAFSSRHECRHVAESLAREIALCRGDVRGAVRGAVDPVSLDLAFAVCGVQGCSELDSGDAGGLAVALGRQYQSQSSVMRALEIRMKGMTDMMTATAMVFAPMVLGMSVAMLEPLSDLAGFQGMGDTSTVLSVYLVELCAVISLLMSSIGSGEGLRQGLWRFCIMCPVSLLVFQLCSSLQL